MQAQAQAAMQNASAEWQSRLQNVEDQAEQTSGSMQTELRRLQHKVDEVHNAAYHAENSFKQECAVARSQRDAFDRERADLRTEMMEYRDRLAIKDQELQRMLQEKANLFENAKTDYNTLQMSQAEARTKLAACESHIDK